MSKSRFSSSGTLSSIPVWHGKCVSVFVPKVEISRHPVSGMIDAAFGNREARADA